MRVTLLTVAAFAGSALAAAVQTNPWINTTPKDRPADLSDPAYNSIVDAIEDAQASGPIQPDDTITDLQASVQYSGEPRSYPSGIGGGVAAPAAAGASRVPMAGNAQRQPTAARAPASTRQRDETSVRYNLRRVNQVLVPLEQALQRKPRYWRTPSELDEYFKSVWDQGNVVVNELSQGAVDIRFNAGSINDAEALGLQRQVSAMDTSLTNVVTAIIASKRDVDQIYRRKEVLDLLVRAEIETNAFVESIISKLSGFSQVVGRSIKSKFVNNLDRGIKEYRR